MCGEGALYDAQVVVNGACGVFICCNEGVGDDECEFGGGLREGDGVCGECGVEGDVEGVALDAENGGGLVHAVIGT